MEEFIMFNCFILAFYIPLLLFCLLTRTVPRLKILDKYSHMADILKLNMHISHVDENDMKKIKGGLSNMYGCIGGSITIDILAILGMVNIFNAGFLCTFIFFCEIVFFGGLIIFVCIKKLHIFKNPDDFNKRNGIIIKYKVKYGVRSIAFKRTYMYSVIIGTCDDNGNPIVFKMQMGQYRFDDIKKGNKWAVVMYKGRPATIILQ